MTASQRSLAAQLAERYGLRDIGLTPLDTPVNDVVAVTSASDRFALKLYHRGRTAEAVQWELDLLTHLRRHGAPVVQPIPGQHGLLEQLTVDAELRLAALFAWAPGAKPAPAHGTYVLLGEAAARIHRAADGFVSPLARDGYDAAVLVDEQLQRMRPLLREAGRWPQAVALGQRLVRRLSDPTLDQGICHLDLTLDNVHVGERLTVFDFDSAGTCWRAIEPWGVLRYSADYFHAWLTGYRSVRPFGSADEAAVAVFGIVGDLRGVAWQLGVAESSRGRPLLGAADLPAVVDGWLAWEADHLDQ